MKYPSLKFLDKVNVKVLHTEELAYYAYTLRCCQYPASVISGEWYQRVEDVCSRKIAELREDISCRIESEGKSDSLVHALDVIDGTDDLVKDSDKWDDSTDHTHLSDKELIELHSMCKWWYDMRRAEGMEVFTRSYQWRIVNELLGRKGHGVLAQIMELTEFIEADNHAHNLGMPYTIGERITTFMPSDYESDETLICHISELARKADYVSREELIQIADYIQTEIVENGETADHLDLVNVILCTGMPSFDYPKILQGLERTTSEIAKTDAKPRIELANYYSTLWAMTLKASYLRQLEQTVRQCYLTLASGKTYPGLGVDMDDPRSVASAVKLLEDHSHTLQNLSDRYDVDKLTATNRSA